MHYRYLFPILVFLIILNLNSCADKRVPPSGEAEHNTTVWLLEKFGESENQYATELKERLLTRLLSGVNSLNLGEDKPVRIFFLRSSTPSAFSQCNGSIFVTEGLVTSVPGLGELAAVIAHEIAHVYREDACYIESDENGLISYSNSVEVQTDMLATKILQASFIDPRFLASALQVEYRIFSGPDSEKDTIQSRLNALNKGLEMIPPIRTKFAEERLFNKLRSGPR